MIWMRGVQMRAIETDRLFAWSTKGRTGVSNVENRFEIGFPVSYLHIVSCPRYRRLPGVPGR